MILGKEVATAITAVLYLWGCSNARKPDSTTSSIRLGHHLSVQTLNPLTSHFGMESVIVDLLGDGLVEDSRGKNHLAQAIHSVDGMVWTIRLRDDVRFHDETLLTSEDVISTLNIVMSLKSSGYSDQFKKISKIRKIGSHELEIVLEKPYWSFRRLLTFPILPQRYFRKDTFHETSFQEHPIGTGPFKVHEERGKILRFERFVHYFKGTPKLHFIEIVPFPTKEMAWAELIRGQIDLYIDPFSDAELFDQLGNGFQRIQVTPPYGYVLYLAVDSNLFADRRVRRALIKAINRKRLHSASPGIEGPFPEWIYGQPEISFLPAENQDAREAGRLLDQAGWILQKNDSVRSKNGRPFEFPLRFLQNEEIQIRLARAVANDLFDVGIKVDLQGTTLSESVRSLQDTRQGATIDFFTQGDNVDRIRKLFHASGIKDGGNLSAFSNVFLDRLLNDADDLSESAARNQIYSKALAIVHEEIPAIFLDGATGWCP